MSLLEKINRGGAVIHDLMKAIATPNVVMDPAMRDMLTPEQLQVAQQRAQQDANYRMQEAAAKGIPWYSLPSIRDMAGQRASDDFIASAASSVEELRKRRDADARRKGIEALVTRIASGEDPDMRGKLTTQQIEMLRALPPDEQAVLLSKFLFPKESGLNVATQGTVIGTRYKLANGNMGYTIQDPSTPEGVRIVDTGQPYISEDPSKIRELAALTGRPELLAMAEELERRQAAGSERGKVNVQRGMELQGLLSSNESHKRVLLELREDLAQLPTNALTGRVLQTFSSRFQAAQAALYEEALANIAALKERGVSLTPITEKELEVLFTTSPKLTNKPEANLAIIDERLRRIDGVMRRVRAELEYIDAGGNADQFRGPPPAAAAPPAAPAAPARSTIPVLPQHQRQ